MDRVLQTRASIEWPRILHSSLRTFRSPHLLGCRTFALRVAVSLIGLLPGVLGTAELVATASSTAEGTFPNGAIDGERFQLEPSKLWRGRRDVQTWWWQATFEKPRIVGAILQIVGDDALVLRNTPGKYVWQCSRDAQTWQDLSETAVANERRMFRIHRLNKPHMVIAIRLKIEGATEGSTPVLREAEFATDPTGTVSISSLGRCCIDNR